MYLLPRFWDLILDGCKKDIIKIPITVYEELKAGYRDDELLDWANRNKKILFSPLTEQTFSIMQQIAEFVNNNFVKEKAQEFLSSKDLEIIAFAKSENLILVTMEGRLELKNSKGADGKYHAQVKIPNVCEFFEIEWKNLFDMLRILKGKYGISL